MTPQDVLGVPRSASIVEIKKAYARLLKQNRPDEDPVAFQKLQQAYEACIARARQRDERRAGARVAATEVATATVEDLGEGEAGDATPATEPLSAQAQHPGGEEAPAPQDTGPRPPPRRPPLFPPNTSAPPPPRRAARILEPAMPAVRQQALFDQMFELAATQGVSALGQWLNTCEDWYSLQAKEQAAAPLVERLVRDGKRLDLDSLKLLIEFFDLAAQGLDPRVHRVGQSLYERHEFRRALADIRQRHQTWAERLMYRELTQPHDRWRRAFLFCVPMQGSRLRGLAMQILSANEDQALELLQPEALSFWMSLTDPRRLTWNALASTLVQAVLASSLVAGAIASQAQDRLQIWAYLGLSFASLWCVSWLILRLIGVILRRVEQRRMARTGSKLPQAGESILYDPQSVFVLGVALCALLVCLLRAGAIVPAEATAWIGLLPSLGLPFLLLGNGRLRWEMGLMALLVMVALNQVVELYLPGLAQPEGNGLTIALSLSLLVALLADSLHALYEKLPRPLARREFNPGALGLGLAAILLMGVLADGKPPAPAAPAVTVESPSQAQQSAPLYTPPAPQTSGADGGWQPAPEGEASDAGSVQTLPAACDCGPPPRLRGNKPAGTLSWARLRARYNSEGVVELVQLEADSGDQAFNEAAMAHAYRAWHIRPGMLDGVPQGGSVAVTVEQHYPFLNAP